jgi:heavy metal sensor kinase
VGWSIRTRLTLWYGLVLAAILVVFSLAVYALLRDSMYSELDRQLREDVERSQDELGSLLEGRAPTTEHETWLVELWAEGPALLRSWPSFDGSPLGSPPAVCAERRMAYYDVTLADGLALRAGCRTVSRGDAKYVLRSARAASRIARELAQLRLALALASPLALAIAVVGGLFLASRVLKPLKRMADQARSISAYRLNERLGVPNPNDELGALATAFNETFARLERSFVGLRRFTADASHELRTPLTAIRTTGEVALRGHLDAAAAREVISSMLEEADALRHLVENLLMLSRGDAGHFELKRDSVEVGALAREVAHHLDVLADEKHQRIEVTAPQPVTIAADARLLRSAVINLVDNAIKYSPERTTVRVRVDSAEAVARVEVEDEGPGIPEEHREKIFDRFYRIDAARTRKHGGTGLGLSIARWAIEAQGGRLTLDGAPQRGAIFRIELPRH